MADLQRWQTRDGGQQAAQGAALLELEDRLLQAMQTAGELAKRYADEGNDARRVAWLHHVAGLEQAVYMTRTLRREELRTDTPNGEVPGPDPLTVERQWANDLQADAARQVAAGTMTHGAYLGATRRAGLIGGR